MRFNISKFKVRNTVTKKNPNHIYGLEREAVIWGRKYGFVVFSNENISSTMTPMGIFHHMGMDLL